MLSQRKRFLEKLPEINKSLEAVEALVAKRDAGGGALAADFELADGIFARAEVKVRGLEGGRCRGGGAARLLAWA